MHLDLTAGSAQGCARASRGEGPRLTENDDSRRIELPAAAPARWWPHLVGVSGAETGLVFRLFEGETLVGRGDEADIRLRSGTASRRHAILQVKGNQIAIEDLGSLNGTLVNLDAISEPRILKDGDHVAFGNVTMLRLTYAVCRDAATHPAAISRATGDPGGAASNTSQLMDWLRSRHAYARRHEKPLTLVFFRVERLSSDSGEAGDEESRLKFIRALADGAKRSMGNDDLLAQSADNELMALLQSDEQEGARIADHVRALTLGLAGGDDIQPAFSVRSVVIALPTIEVVAPETILVAAHERAQESFLLLPGAALPAEVLHFGSIAENTGGDRP